MGTKLLIKRHKINIQVVEKKSKNHENSILISTQYCRAGQERSCLKSSSLRHFIQVKVEKKWYLGILIVQTRAMSDIVGGKYGEVHRRTT